ncbi:unnamed protein product [Moneuplotes crassus]|uniref:Uncharacterized protein n=1 Tax=Euplotes crassus TaxID=5936 RepID=A0AAD1UJR1_EUPCR|nr:unnamed protein product [Moneuplotes crassus]
MSLKFISFEEAQKRDLAKEEKIKRKHRKYLAFKIEEEKRYPDLMKENKKLVTSYLYMLQFEYDKDPSDTFYVEVMETLITEFSKGLPKCDGKLKGDLEDKCEKQEKEEKVKKEELEEEVKVDENYKEAVYKQLYILIFHLIKLLIKNLSKFKINLCPQYKRILTTLFPPSPSTQNYATWIPPQIKPYANRTHDPSRCLPSLKRNRKQIEKFIEEEDLKEKDLRLVLKEKLDRDLRRYHKEMSMVLKEVDLEFYERTMKNKYVMQFEKEGNVLDLEIERAEEVYNEKIEKFKAKLKNKKNHKNSRRQRDNKRFKKLDPELFTKIFHDISRGMSHEQKKREFYKKLTPKKKRIYDSWTEKGYTRSIELIDKPTYENSMDKRFGGLIDDLKKTAEDDGSQNSEKTSEKNSLELGSSSKSSREVKQQDEEACNELTWWTDGEESD